MTSAVAVVLTADAARALTEEVKADAAVLWGKLLRLYEGDAHTALGYSSWGAYYEAEFGAQPKTGYRLLEAARVVDSLSDTHVTPPSQNAARELVPVLRDDPDAVPEIWGEVVEEYGEQPTAADVRTVVECRVSSRTTNQQQRVVSGIAEKARRIVEVAHHIDLEAIKSLPEEEKTEWKLQLSSARTVLSRVIGAL